MVVGSSAAAPGATRTGAAAPEAAAPRAFLARGCRAVHSQIRNQEISKQKHKIHEYPAQNHQRKKKLALGGCRATMPRRGAPSPHTRAWISEGGGIGRSRACSPGLRPPSGRARGCGHRHAGRRRAGLRPCLGAASPGRRARPRLEAAPPPRERREREEARMRTRERAGLARGEVPGLAWKPRRHREKGGRGRRHGCGRERELGFGPSIYLAAEWLGRRQEHRSSEIRGVKIILLPWTPCASVLATRSILFKYV